jgi:UPF0716 protein FxsA
VAPLLFLLFIGLPIAELYVIIEVGQAIGLAPTLALLIADSLVGVVLVRAQGRSAWQRFNVALVEGRVPGSAVFDGAMVLLGGALLLTPGFITDIFGILLLLPPTRAMVKRLMGRMAKRRFAFTWGVAMPGGRSGGKPAGGPATGPFGPNGPPRPGGRRGRPEYDYEGTAHEVPDAAPELPEQGSGHG